MRLKCFNTKIILEFSVVKSKPNAFLRRWNSFVSWFSLHIHCGVFTTCKKCWPTETSKHASNNRITDWINTMLRNSSVSAWIVQRSARVTWPLLFRSDLTHPQHMTSVTVEKPVFSACLPPTSHGNIKKGSHDMHLLFVSRCLSLGYISEQNS
jgi:hypothetical protein